MKKTLLAITILFTLNGCSVINYLTEQKAKQEFKSLCARYELAICGDINIPAYNNADWDEIKAIASEIPFNYGADDGEQYDYIIELGDDDCEDWSITFYENNLRVGNFKRNQAEWIFGELNGIGHAWTLVTLNDETRLFDNGFTTGISIDKAYSDLGYKEEFVIYKY